MADRPADIAFVRCLKCGSKPMLRDHDDWRCITCGHYHYGGLPHEVSVAELDDVRRFMGRDGLHKRTGYDR